MYILTIIPIARGIPFDTLTYYGAEAYAPGTVVIIPFGRQQIHGVVVSAISLLEAKSSVKQSSFSLKKIKSVVGHIPFFSSFMLAVQDTSAQTLTPLGAVASAVMPQTLFEYMGSEKMAALLATHEHHADMRASTEEVVSGLRAERLDAYKRIIRGAFAQKKSVLFIAPTIRSVMKWKASLEKGIGKHVVLFHGKVTKKELRGNVALVKTNERPLIIFATPAFMMIPRADIGVIIVEDESQNLYKTHDRYGTDLRIFIRHLAVHAQLALYYGDTLPRLETLERLGKSRLPRNFIPENIHVVGIEPYRTILPSEVIELIRHAQKKKERLFIYTNRKGVAPLSRCGDCGTVVTCASCTLPMVLRNKVGSDGTRTRYFICTYCTATLPATHTCAHCNSWNIVPVSIGTESIRDAIEALVGGEPVVTIDDDLAPDATGITALLERVQKQKFAIIVGTVKVLPFIERVQYAVFPFFDRLLSIPSLYTTEEALRLVVETAELVNKGVIIATKNPDFPFLKQLETKKLNAIIADELSLRKELQYPPFGSIIKLSITVPAAYRQELTEIIEQFFATSEAAIEVTTMPARSMSVGSLKILLSWIIKADTSYIEEHGSMLSLFCTSLRYPYKIEQNPERL